MHGCNRSGEIFRKFWKLVHYQMKKPLMLAMLSFSIGILPLIPVVIAGSIASYYNCTLNEAAAHPCIVMGEDYGKTFYALSMLGWFAIATLPIGFFGMCAAVLWAMIKIILKKKAS